MQRHLIPGLLTEHGLTPDQLVFPSEAITLIADGYTREVLRPMCPPPPQPHPAPCSPSHSLLSLIHAKASSISVQACISMLVSKAAHVHQHAAFDMLQLLVKCLPLIYASRQGCVRVCGMQAGVRSLSRSLAAVCRHVAVQIVSQQDHAETQPHQEPQDSRGSVSSKQQSGSSHPHSSTLTQQQQQVSCITSSQHMHATSDQICQRAHADLDTSPLESSATASAAPFFWGGLWGGLRGAFSPPRQRPTDVKRRREASHQLAQASRYPGHSHLHPAHLQTSHAMHAGHEHADANSASRQPHQRRITRAIFPADLASMPSTASSKALLASMGSCTTSTGEAHHQGQASNLCGGINDVKPAHSEVGLLTVTAELIEEVLGPCKYNETDSADNLVAPGDLQMASCVPHVSATLLPNVAEQISSIDAQSAPRTIH